MSDQIEDQEKQSEEIDLQKEDSEPSQNDYVSRADLERALNDLHKFKSKASELETQLKSRDMDDLKKKEEWQKVSEHWETEANDYKQKYESIQQSVIHHEKFNALKYHALKLGLRKEAEDDLENLDLSEIDIETTNTGRIRVLNADRYAAKIKTLKPHWFGKSITNLNTNSPDDKGQVSTRVTYAELEKLRAKAEASGNYEEYKEKLLEFKKTLKH